MHKSRWLAVGGPVREDRRESGAQKSNLHCFHTGFFFFFLAKAAIANQQLVLNREF